MVGVFKDSALTNLANLIICSTALRHLADAPLWLAEIRYSSA